MASLNTLRTRGGAIITIVIGVALLSFVLGDFSPSGCADHSVGRIEGKKIEYFEYEQAVKDLTNQYEMYEGRSMSGKETERIRDEAWAILINKYAIEPSYERLGLSISDAEEIDMVSGEYLSPVLTQRFTNPETGLYDADAFYQYHSQASVNPMYNMEWQQMQLTMKQERINTKYHGLIGAALVVNDLEVAAGVEAGNRVSDARIVYQPYSELSDDEIEVTDKDIRAFYDKHKSSFKCDESRELEYVVFEVIPSEADYQEHEVLVKEKAEQFKVNENPMLFANRNSSVRPSNIFVKEEDIRDAAMLAAIWDKPEGFYGPTLTNDVYTMARLAESKTMSEQVMVDFFMVSSIFEELADTIATELKNGTNFELIAAQYSDRVGQQKEFPIAVNALLASEESITHKKFAEDLITAKKGDVVLTENLFVDYGEHIVVAQVIEKSEPVKMGKIAVVTHKVEPSDETRNMIYSEVTDFQVEAGDNYEGFKKAAADNGLYKRVASISTSNHNIHGFEEPSSLVNWAFNSKQGTVSTILSIDGDHVVAALTNIIPQGYASVGDAEREIKPHLIRQKKAEALIENFKGATLEEVASNLGKEIIAAEGVNSNSTYAISGIGGDRYLIGAIAATSEVGKLSNPIAGNLGVYLIEVDDIKTNSDITPASERVKAESVYTDTYIYNKTGEAVYELINVTDRRLKLAVVQR